MNINGVSFSGNVSIINGQVFVNGKAAQGSEQVQGDGNKAEESRTFEDHFRRVEASGIDGLQIQCGNSQEKLQLQGDSNILPLIETRVEDGVLHIQPKDGKSFSTQQPIQVTLQMEGLEHLELSGAVQSDVTGLHSDRLGLDLSGASRVRLEGAAQRLDLDMSGASSVSAMGLVADEVRAELSGASQAQVSAEKSLHLDGSGASALTYKGNPTVHQDLSGAARLRQA